MRKILFLLVISFSWNCSNVFFQNLFNRNKTSFPLPVLLSGAPKVILPEAIPSQALRVEEDPNVPRLLGRSQVPVGKVYNLTLDLKDKKSKEQIVYKSLSFLKPVKLEFPVDLQELESKGFTQEFYVWYKDFATKEWKILQKGKLDIESSSVKVETNHFTPFILTALPNIPGTQVASAASCFTTESASWNLQGVLDDSSVSQAKFGIIGEGYQYYQDRPYFVKENEGAFRELGLELSLLFPTCQGGTGTCGNSLLHSDSTTSEYLAFNAVKDIDVYVMYDTRGGVSPSDISQDADWLQSGFTLLSGKYIYTTEPGLDPAQTPGASGYKVYKRTYLQGSRVSLGGNKKGTSAAGLASNYWVVVKAAGTQGSIQSSAILCTSGPDPKIPNTVKGNIFPGSDKMLLWLLYSANNPPDKIIVRRSEISPPMTPAMGDEPSGIEVTPYSFVDTGLVQGHTYYYSIFALNADGVYNGITVGMGTTGPDTDGDGLSDATELTLDPQVLSPSFWNNTVNPAIANNPDFDGDGINDFEEMARGVLPLSTDNDPPIIDVEVLSQNASSGVVDLRIHLTDASEHMMLFCYIRRFEPGMTEAEFLKKPFSVYYGDPYDPALDFTVNHWQYNCDYGESYNDFTYKLGKYGAGKPDRFAIWTRDSFGNVSEPIIKEFQGMEANAEHTFMLNLISYPDYPKISRGVYSAYFDLAPPFSRNNPNPTTNTNNPPITFQLVDSNYQAIENVGYVIPAKESQLYGTLRAADFIALSNNMASYYESRRDYVSGIPFIKKNEISINYQFSRDRPQPKHFPVNIGSDSGIAAFYPGSTNLQESFFKIQAGLLSADSYALPGVSAGFFPSFIMESDFGQGFGLLNGNFFQDYLLDSWNAPLYKTFGEGMNNTNFSGILSSDRLERYNPQTEAETFAVFKQSSVADLKILYRKSGDLNFTSIQATGIPTGFVGKQIQFVSYKDFSGNTIYHLYLLGKKTSNGGTNVLLRFLVGMSGGIPNLSFDREIIIDPSRDYARFYIDKSGRYIFAINKYLAGVETFFNMDQGPFRINWMQMTMPYDLQFALVPNETVPLSNIGGYSKLRVLPAGAYSDYRIYGFLPANSDLIFRHHVYDSKGNECESPTTTGTEDVLATATGNYGVPPIPLTVTSDNTQIQNAKRVKAPSSAANLVLESSYTQGASSCRIGLVSRDTAVIPVRKKIVQATTSYYHDFSLNPANVPSTYNTAPSPAGYDNADFKKWESLSKSSPQRLGTYVRKNILFWWPYAVIDEWNPCIITDVTMEDGRAICHNAFGGYPAFVEDYVNQYDRYTFTGQYVYSGDKLIPTP
ncbi:hypothetical protein [Leptospira haakeii]|uniref:Fibronectin type-III domain-containing protein n=1 Tax=Leptospira haakeii TaxID=2023198 RepID=A0ABX4PPQ8_9LEPT|nr:hypothetical protein [Leptospira haakeii]PKA16856.1 hypothetical protein CH363_05520 [Leptospira haakeii]